MRIASLLGSATEIVYALGLGDCLVGISHECDYPPESQSLPRLSRPRFDPKGLTSGEVDAAVRQCMLEYGSVYEIDRPLLTDLRPDIVLTQAVCEVCAVPTGSVEEAVADLPGSVAVVSLDAHTIEDILGSFVQVAAAANATEAGVALRTRVQNRLDEVCSRIQNRPRPRTLLLEWLDPPFAPGHWVPEMVGHAGGDNLIGTPGAPSREIQWSDLDDLHPEVLLIEPCGFDLDQAADDADRARERLLQVASGPIRQKRAWLLHSGWFSRSGPRVVEGVEALARLLHPSSFDDPVDSDIARRWF